MADIPATEGLHEIHISVNPAQVAQLRLYCLFRKYKPIFAAALYGDHPNQLMISKYKTGPAQMILEHAFEIANDMREYGLEVIRIKVEAMMSCKGVPRGDKMPDNSQNYYEFHLKLMISSEEELSVLENALKKNDAHISYNTFKKELEPLVTLRLYKVSYDQAISLKDKMILDIEQAGFNCNGGMHSEYSVYDDNPELDAGWLPSQ